MRIRKLGNLARKRRRMDNQHDPNQPPTFLLILELIATATELLRRWRLHR
jgi:hypothetical protein